MTMWQQPALVLVIGYLLGAIPFGLLLTKACGAGDLRQIGSGNIGATNVLRTGRKGLAAATLLLDLMKGAAAVLIARMIDPLLAPLGGFAVFVGHCWPIWLGFRGGKGVATMMGIVTALSWPIGLIYAVTWIGLLSATRISSVGGMGAAIIAPVAMALWGAWDYVPLTLGLAFLVLWKHKTNIARLLKGREPKIGADKA